MTKPTRPTETPEQSQIPLQNAKPSSKHRNPSPADTSDLKALRKKVLERSRAGAYCVLNDQECLALIDELEAFRNEKKSDV